MLIKTNYPYLKRESVPRDAVEAWLNENPHRRAENMTGLVRDLNGPFGRTLEGMQKDREAAMVDRTDLTTSGKRRLTFEQHKREVLTRLNRGEVIKLAELKSNYYYKKKVKRIVDALRKDGVEVLEIRKGLKIVGYVKG